MLFGVVQRRECIFKLEFVVVLQDFVVAHPRRDQLKNVLDPQSHSADCGRAVGHHGMRSDSVKEAR